MTADAVLPSRFWAKVDTGSRAGCWLWLGSVNSNGYALYHHNGRVQLGHRVAYTAFVGLIPDGLTIDHLCRVRRCVNPAHLDAVTLAENLRRSPEFGANKTHCKRGHALAGYNVVRNSQGSRYCRTCENARRRAARRAVSPVEAVAS